MLSKLRKTFVEKTTEAWTACMFMMVQGNLFAITYKHAITAGKTAVIAAIATTATLTLFKEDNKWFNVWITGALTSIADIIVHPTHFGSEWTEALATGFGAAMLAWFVQTYVFKK